VAAPGAEAVKAMAYDEGLAERLREHFAETRGVTEKKMFGGLAFLLHGHMCCGIIGETLMARVGPEQYEAALKRPHAREMDFTGRAMRGLVYVEPEGFESDRDLRRWLALAEKFVTSLPPK
jgi:TfoX/Sxy family transcriptional regulator of competence genes